VLERYRRLEGHNAFIVEALAKGERRRVADALMQLTDPRISDKWGPAGCLELGSGRWLFFGWAPE
jgi:hypothetical protein